MHVQAIAGGDSGHGGGGGGGAQRPHLSQPRRAAGLISTYQLIG